MVSVDKNIDIHNPYIIVSFIKNDKHIQFVSYKIINMIEEIIFLFNIYNIVQFERLTLCCIYNSTNNVLACFFVGIYSLMYLYDEQCNIY